MSADGSLFVSPTGKTPEQLFLTVRTLIDTLNRVSRTWGQGGDLSELEQQIAELQSDVQEIIEALESFDPEGGLTPQQAFELSLVTAVNTVLGSVSNLALETIKQSQKAAEATIRSLLTGQKNKTAIRVEQAARLTDREAFASQISTLEAQLGAAQAAIVEEITARTNADNALSEVDQTITTALNGNIAQVQILTQSIDGIEQKFAVTLNQNGQVTGLIQLDGTPIGTAFTVVADKFMVAQPDQTGGAPVPVFTISNVGGTPKLVFRGDMLADGSITAAKINVSNLAALNADMGHIRAGKMESPPEVIATGKRLYIDLIDPEIILESSA